MASGTIFPPVPTLTCLFRRGSAAVSLYLLTWDPRPILCGLAGFLLPFPASTGQGTPCLHTLCLMLWQWLPSPSSTATTSPIVSLMPSGHWSWTASGFPGNRMGLLRITGTAAHEIHPHCAPSSFFMPSCSSICTLDNMPITHAGVWAHTLRNRLLLYSLPFQRTLHL